MEVEMDLFCIHILVIANLFLTVRGFESQFEHSVWLDPKETYRLHWSVDNDDKSIMFGVEVKTNGWVGFGISKGLSGKIEHSDLMIGWVNSHGKTYLKDCHGTKDGLSRFDRHQDLHLVKSYTDKKLTFLKFKRKLTTCDKDDRDIKQGTIKVLFGWGSSILGRSFRACSILSERSSKMKSRSLNIMNYVLNNKKPLAKNYADLTHKKVAVPAKKTTYWCTLFKMSDFMDVRSPKHIVEIHPIIQKRDTILVHHIVLYACNGDFDAKNLSYSGECHTTNTPKSISSCTAAGGMFAWGNGGSNFKFPENAGYPIGTKDSSKYFVFEAHFDNKLERSDIVDTSGVRLYYAQPRKYEAAMLTVGMTVTDNMIIPPGMDKWTMKGICTKGCTQQMDQNGALSRESIKIFASFPHAHESAIAIHTTLVRNGKEVEEIMRDDNYDFHYQQMYPLNKEVEVKAGDEVFTYCTYRTLDKTFTTLGGMGTDKEMCLNFMMYYPRVNLTACLDDEMVVQPAFTASYANPVYPACMEKKKLLANWQLANWTGVEWTKSMVNELYDFYNGNDPLPMVQPRCFGLNAYHYNLPSIYRPLVKERLVKKKRKCPRHRRQRRVKQLKFF